MQVPVDPLRIDELDMAKVIVVTRRPLMDQEKDSLRQYIHNGVMSLFHPGNFVTIEFLIQMEVLGGGDNGDGL